MGHDPLEQAGIWIECVQKKQPVYYNDLETSPDREVLPEGTLRCGAS